MFKNPYDVWHWRTGIATAVTTGTQHLAGFEVRATERTIGTVAEDSAQLGTTCLVVDNGAWIPGRRMMLPGGTVEGVDCATGVVRLDRTESQLHDSPDYGPERLRPTPLLRRGRPLSRRHVPRRTACAGCPVPDAGPAPGTPTRRSWTVGRGTSRRLSSNRHISVESPPCRTSSMVAVHRSASTGSARAHGGRPDMTMSDAPDGSDFSLVCDDCGLIAGLLRAHLRSWELAWQQFSRYGWVGDPRAAGPHRCPRCLQRTATSVAGGDVGAVTSSGSGRT
ncbi:hypothetical protein Daura_30205 [Dactylosporangium aurantiacum]|uniref:Uncharacterized protein n=1 Tax=Dactylosporangium aurantiacum TaxID=35754 RepID=A0A9Q9IBP7_9ACTN|nr:hypothetical protein [Dactylosporangium aurantiacum]MDG6110479.1 hypothetical protein [Dactylosporangium aurantiacum]UWZ51037.1 hypothetical protein Daura_30205 [Dactylosporangium aurantiacum]